MKRLYQGSVSNSGWVSLFGSFTKTVMVKQMIFSNTSSTDDYVYLRYQGLYMMTRVPIYAMSSKLVDMTIMSHVGAVTDVFGTTGGGTTILTVYGTEV